MPRASYDSRKSSGNENKRLTFKSSFRDGVRPEEIYEGMSGRDLKEYAEDQIPFSRRKKLALPSFLMSLVR